MDSFHCSVFYFTDFLKFMMPSLNRKLLLFPVKHNGDDDSTCPGSCHEIPSVLLPPTPHLHPKHSITITMSVVAFAIASCLLFGFLVAVIRRYCFRQNVRGSGTPVLFLMRVDSLREDDHRVVDHPIWLINTVGLDRSVIDSIAICEFKKGDGLIDGTECAICLGEFEEGEDLRLLPKCNHAFHVSCIDTWLGSHKNCPLCRAPIVRDVPLPCGEIILEESRSNMETLEPSSVMVSGNVDDCERKSEGESGSRGENEVRKQPKRAPSSIGSSSFTETRRTTAVNKLSRFAKDANNMRDAVCTKDSESSWNKIRRSSSDAGILSFKKTSRQTPIHLF